MTTTQVHIRWNPDAGTRTPVWIIVPEKKEKEPEYIGVIGSTWMQ